MIASLRGRIVQKDAEQVIIECAGVGYGVAMSLGALERLRIDTDAQLYVHTHLTQDSLRLFGFLDLAERRVFDVLISISGVGPRLALAVLSTLAPKELADAVASDDLDILTRVPGVGKKKAERLLLDLRDRLPKVVAGVATGRAGREGDLISALVNLGFRQDVAEGAATQAMAAHPAESDLAVLVRAALRATTPKPG